MNKPKIIALIIVSALLMIIVWTFVFFEIKKYKNTTKKDVNVEEAYVTEDINTAIPSESQDFLDDTMNESDSVEEDNSTSDFADDEYIKAYYDELESEKNFEFVNIYDELYSEYETNRFYSYEHNISFELPFSSLKIAHSLEERVILEYPTQIFIVYKGKKLANIQILPEDVIPSFRGGWDYLTSKDGKSYYLVGMEAITSESYYEYMRIINAWIYNSFVTYSSPYPSHVLDESIYPYIVQGKYVKDEEIKEKSKVAIENVLLGDWIIETNKPQHFNITFDENGNSPVTARHMEPFHTTYKVSDNTIEFKGEYPLEHRKYKVVSMTKNKIVLELEGRAKSVGPLILYRDGTTTKHEDMHQLEVLHNFMDYAMLNGYDNAVYQYGTDAYKQDILNEVEHDLNTLQMEFNMGEYYNTYYIYAKSETDTSASYTVIRGVEEEGQYRSLTLIKVHLVIENGIWKVENVHIGTSPT